MRELFAKIGNLFAGLIGTAFFAAFAVLTIFSLPLSVIAVMRVSGWEWWSSLIILVLIQLIPIIGQIAYIVFTVMGAYYFISADFDWTRAVNEAPISVTELTTEKFETYKNDVILPQFKQQCKSNAKNRYGIDGRITVNANRFCECFSRIAVQALTQEELIYQEKNRKPSPGLEARMMAAAKTCTS